MDINELVKGLLEARRGLSTASRGQPDPESVQRFKEDLAHHVSEVGDYVGRLEEAWLQEKGRIFMREVAGGASTDAASKRMSAEAKAKEATVAKLKRTVSDGQNRITNAQSLLKRQDQERNV